MRDRIIWLIAALLIGLVVSNTGYAQVTNLLDNGGFEDGVTTPWSEYGGSSLQVVEALTGAEIAEDVLDGRYCLHVVVPQAGANSWDFGLQHSGHTFESGKKYTLSAFFKSKQGTLQVNFKPELAADPWTGYGDQVITITNEWQEYSITTPVMSADVNPATITFHIGFAPGDFWVDHVRFYEGDYVAPELGPKPKARKPDPADGSTYPLAWASLKWEAGDTAASHDVYFGTNYDAVANGTGGTSQGNQTTKYFMVGFAPYPYSDGLVPGTTYYWRIDEVEADGVTKHTGNVWSFFVPPNKAYDPDPDDGMYIVPPEPTLIWSSGYGVMVHYIYFGDDYDTVANAPENTGEFTTEAFYTPTGPLESNKTYYWRVDESNPTEQKYYKGDVWSFTTAEPGLGNAVMERWENITGTVLSALRSDPRFPASPDVTEDATSFSWDGDDIDNYGARIYGWLYAPATGNYTFWIAGDDDSELWLSPDESPESASLIASIAGYTGITEFEKYSSQTSVAIPLLAGERYYIEALWKEGEGGDHCNVVWQGPGISTRTTIDGQYLAPFLPVNAYGSSPANRATGVFQHPVLSWRAGIKAASHQLYFGTDATAVANATTASPEYKGPKALGDELYDPGVLEWGKSYYWRVDELNPAEPEAPWKGAVWSFTTADYLIIDDFEDYNDEPPDRVFETWIDGFGGSTNGSISGYPYPIFEDGEHFCETSIVHSGGQSMPMFYDNNMKYSEATKTLVGSDRDWTQHDLKRLSLSYYGHIQSQGSLVEGPAGTYTLTGAGYDIWLTDVGELDEFHYAWKSLGAGAASIIAKVEAPTGENMNDWVKAGVMIRETLDPNSTHAFMCLTNTQGVAFQYRPEAAGTSVSVQQAGVSERPQWLRLTKDIGGNFTAYHANDVGGTAGTWTQVGTYNIQMNTPCYIGLAITSHTRFVTATAVFSNITTTGNVSGGIWTNQDIGIQSNAPERMYVSIKDGAGQKATVYNPDLDAANVTAWTTWGQYDQGIALSEFTAVNPSLNLANIDSIALGFGTFGNTTQPGGSGLMFIDDIRVEGSRCVSQLSKPDNDFNSNCVVDMPDLEILTDNWLKSNWLVTPEVPSTTGLVGYYRLENNAQDSSGQGHHGTAANAPTYVAGQTGQGMLFNGSNQYVDLGTWDPSADTGQLTVALWANWNGLSGSYQGLIGKRDTWSATEMMWNIEANVDTGALGFFREGSGPDNGNFVLPVDQWTHVAATFDGTTATFYINGSATGSGGFSFGSDPGAALVFGAVEGGGSNPFNGALDEVRLYNRSLSQGEVASLAGKTTAFDQELYLLLRPHDANIDVNGDGVIDFMDYTGLIDTWLDEQLWP